MERPSSASGRPSTASGKKHITILPNYFMSHPTSDISERLISIIQWLSEWNNIKIDYISSEILMNNTDKGAIYQQLFPEIQTMTFLERITYLFEKFYEFEECLYVLPIQLELMLSRKQMIEDISEILSTIHQLSKEMLLANNNQGCHPFIMLNCQDRFILGKYKSQSSSSGCPYEVIYVDKDLIHEYNLQEQSFRGYIHQLLGYKKGDSRSIESEEEGVYFVELTIMMYGNTTYYKKKSEIFKTLLSYLQASRRAQKLESIETLKNILTIKSSRQKAEVQTELLQLSPTGGRDKAEDDIVETASPRPLPTQVEPPSSINQPRPSNAYTIPEHEEDPLNDTQHILMKSSIHRDKNRKEVQESRKSLKSSLDSTASIDIQTLVNKAYQNMKNDALNGINWDEVGIGEEEDDDLVGNEEEVSEGEEDDAVDWKKSSIDAWGDHKTYGEVKENKVDVNKALYDQLGLDASQEGYDGRGSMHHEDADDEVVSDSLGFDDVNKQIHRADEVIEGFDSLMRPLNAQLRESKSKQLIQPSPAKTKDLLTSNDMKRNDSYKNAAENENDMNDLSLAYDSLKALRKRTPDPSQSQPNERKSQDRKYDASYNPMENDDNYSLGYDSLMKSPSEPKSAQTFVSDTKQTTAIHDSKPLTAKDDYNDIKAGHPINHVADNATKANKPGPKECILPEDIRAILRAERLKAEERQNRIDDLRNKKRVELGKQILANLFKNRNVEIPSYQVQQVQSSKAPGVNDLRSIASDISSQVQVKEQSPPFIKGGSKLPVAIPNVKTGGASALVNRIKQSQTDNHVPVDGDTISEQNVSSGRERSKWSKHGNVEDDMTVSTFQTTQSNGTQKTSQTQKSTHRPPPSSRTEASEYTYDSMNTPQPSVASITTHHNRPPNTSRTEISEHSQESRNSSQRDKVPLPAAGQYNKPPDTSRTDATDFTFDSRNKINYVGMGEESHVKEKSTKERKTGGESFVITSGNPIDDDAKLKAKYEIMMKRKQEQAAQREESRKTRNDHVGAGGGYANIEMQRKETNAGNRKQIEDDNYSRADSVASSKKASNIPTSGLKQRQHHEVASELPQRGGGYLKQHDEDIEIKHLQQEISALNQQAASKYRPSSTPRGLKPSTNPVNDSKEASRYSQLQQGSVIDIESPRGGGGGGGGGKGRAQSAPRVTKRASSTPRGGHVSSKMNNIQQIKNALSHVCLAGHVHTPLREEIFTTIDKFVETVTELGLPIQFIILLHVSKMLTFKGLYFFDARHNVILKVYGVGPSRIPPELIEGYHKYESSSRSFKSIATASLTSTCDAISVDPAKMKKYFAKD